MSTVTVFDVAQYFLGLPKEEVLTSMKLQKLCFYAQAWGFKRFNEEIVPNEFQAWRHGPVCLELYESHSGKLYIFENDLRNGDLNSLTSEFQKHLNRVWKNYGKYRADQLSWMTHNEAPWVNARIELDIDEPTQHVITKSSIKEFYSDRDPELLIEAHKNSWPDWMN
jgi:uncharacterized phage-associated protein